MYQNIMKELLSFKEEMKKEAESEKRRALYSPKSH